MARCPSCGSNRIRNGYRMAPLPLRTLGIRELLCDYCNRQFRAFSPRPPKQTVKPRRASRHGRSAPAEANAEANANGNSITATPVVKEVAKAPPPQPSHRHANRPPCPQCDSVSTYRRRRTTWERMALAISGKRAYVCEVCGKSFYAARARLDEEMSG